MKLHIIAIILMLTAPSMVFGQSSHTPIMAGLEYELIATYKPARLDHILGPELDDFMKSSTLPTHFQGKFPKARYAVNLYRVKYASIVPEMGNAPTQASGLIAIPLMDKKSLPVVSYQHGTVFDKNFVPSNPEKSMETRIMVARFASQGYVVVGADYFGRGVSSLPDSFLVKESTRQATFDMLWASKNILDSMGIKASHFFASGWSQGGWVTMQFLKKLDTAGINVTAAAVASAPVDVYLIP